METRQLPNLTMRIVSSCQKAVVKTIAAQTKLDICDTLGVVLVPSTVWGALYSAGSSSPSETQGELALPLQNKNKNLAN